MISSIVLLLCVIYAFCLFATTVYSLFRLPLLGFYLKFHLWEKHKKDERPEESEGMFEDLKNPFVTIQLPIFNEMYVVERLIDNIVKIDYPKEKFEIHVLDDSTDETLSISKRKVEEYKEKGFNIELLHRTDRSGYKAGALKEGMKVAKGRFLAIFDADFLPYPDFLKETIPHFSDKNTGIVQTRWEHMNAGHSLITLMQAVHLNVHFTIEQQGRISAGACGNFNGTAGVWRRTTIEDAGGWHSDTLCEDLDLSYRAQMKGWKMVFLENVTAPSELPQDINALKTQQFRWMKGGAQSCKKLLVSVWKSDFTLKQKIFASEHLMSCSLYICLFVLGLVSVPLQFSGNMAQLKPFFDLLVVTPLATVMVYLIGNTKANLFDGYSIFTIVLAGPFLWAIFLSASIGMAFHNTCAVLDGFFGGESAFVRTPKHNVANEKATEKLVLDADAKPDSNKYLQKKISKVTVVEGLMMLYFLLAILAGILTKRYELMQFFISAAAGYGMTFGTSIIHAYKH